jgi:hypothetical protein
MMIEQANPCIDDGDAASVGAAHRFVYGTRPGRRCRMRRVRRPPVGSIVLRPRVGTAGSSHCCKNEKEPSD